MNKISLPISFSNKIQLTWGKQGTEWLAALEAIVNVLCLQWGIKDLELMPTLSYNYVAQGLQYGKPVILKIGIDSKAFKQELQTLLAYKGQGAVAVLEWDESNNVLLLEKITPGTTLFPFFPHNDYEAIRHAAEVIKKIHASQTYEKSHFPLLKDWFSSLRNNTVIDSYHKKAALNLLNFLIASQTSSVLLHGDLHHENILFSKVRGCTAIDPKGIIGDPAFEPGAFIRNPLGKLHNVTNTQDIIDNRIKLFSKYLSLDATRIKQWTYVQAVLAACWDSEVGNENYKSSLKTAEIISNL